MQNFVRFFVDLMAPKFPIKINLPLTYVSCIYSNMYQFGCGILKMVGPRKRDLWTKINILKGNHCILKIRRAPLRQTLDMILENKAVQKLKLEKLFFTKKSLLN